MLFALKRGFELSSSNKRLRSTAALLAAGSVIGLGAIVFAAFAASPVIARQMDEWRLLPRPELVTQLYFTDYRQLPAAAAAGTEQTVLFTVRNLEYQTTTYRYTIIAVAEDDKTEYLVGDGIFTLAHDSSLATSKPVTLLPLKGRVAIRVNLEYEGIAQGNSTPVAQTQSIHYWTTVRIMAGTKAKTIAPDRPSSEKERTREGS